MSKLKVGIIGGISCVGGFIAYKLVQRYLSNKRFGHKDFDEVFDEYYE